MYASVSAAGNKLGIVSPDVPLISNLDNWLNVALIRQYHENLSRRVLYPAAKELFALFGLENIHLQRPSALDKRQLFLVKLLRACMVRHACIVIDRPFLMAPEEKDITFLSKRLELVEEHYGNCQIIDYALFKERYQALYDA